MFTFKQDNKTVKLMSSAFLLGIRTLIVESENDEKLIAVN